MKKWCPRSGPIQILQSDWPRTENASTVLLNFEHEILD